MKLAVLSQEWKKLNPSDTFFTNVWDLVELKEGTEKDIDNWEEGNVTYYVIPFEPVEDEQSGYVWDMFDNAGQPIGRIEKGKFVRWLDYNEGVDVFESLWGNIF